MNLYSHRELSNRIAQNVRRQRLDRNLTQEDLSARSGVPLGTLRTFERTGRISLSGLIKIALALGEENAILKLMEPGEAGNLFDSPQKASKRIRATGRKGTPHG